MKFSYQSALFSILLVQFVPHSYALCRIDDLKIDLEKITQLHRKSIVLLADVLDSQNTTVCLDFKDILGTVTSYNRMKHDLVMAAEKMFEISWKLDRNYGKDGNWGSFKRVANKIRNRTSLLNQYCFNAQTSVVDSSGEEDALTAKLLQAVLEMFIAETFLNDLVTQERFDN